MCVNRLPDKIKINNSDVFLLAKVYNSPIFSYLCEFKFMKITLSRIVAVFIISFATLSHASPLQYAIVVDAGSTTTRFHLFQYQTGKNLPVIDDYFLVNIKPGLSDYANNPEAAGEALKPALDKLIAELQILKVSPDKVSISILATAGMRLLPVATQQAIYLNINNTIKNNYPFPIHKIETISGKMEALYGWLDINYLAGNFESNKTDGSIDMGGASTEIAFATKDYSHADDEITVKIGKKVYLVFAKSFLGLGLTQSNLSMNQNANANNCYPINYPLANGTTGNYNFASCNSIYNDLIQEHPANNLPITGKQTFIAYSGAYFTYYFFDVDQTPDQTSLEKKLQTVCSDSWKQMQQDFPAEPAKYLSTYCANGVYLDNLFYKTYQLQGRQLTITNQIDQHDIDWPLGALLFQIS